MRQISVHGRPTRVRLTCAGTEVRRPSPGLVPADVVLAPAHGRAIRLAREVRDGLARVHASLADRGLVLKEADGPHAGIARSTRSRQRH